MPGNSDKQDRAWADYSERFRREVLPKILDSAIFLSIGTDEGVFDVRQATELGAALLMGKPLLLVCPRGRHIPAALRRAAAEVIDNWDAADANAQARMTAAMHRLLPDK
jgi:hypothetical protein